MFRKSFTTKGIKDGVKTEFSNPYVIEVKLSQLYIGLQYHDL